MTKNVINLDFAAIDTMAQNWSVTDNMKLKLVFIKQILLAMEKDGDVSDQDIEDVITHNFNDLDRKTLFIPQLPESTPTTHLNPEQLLAIFLYRLSWDVANKNKTLEDKDDAILLVILDYIDIASEWYKKESYFNSDLDITTTQKQLDNLKKATEAILLRGDRIIDKVTDYLFSMS